MANGKWQMGALPKHLASAMLAAVNQNGSSYDFEIAVIGGGSAGYAAARAAAQAGRRTALLEGGAEVGGLCILRGCMPSKRLLYAAEVLHQARRAGQWGLRVPAAGFDFAQVMARKDALIKEFAEERRQACENGPFQFIRARARFADPHTLVLPSGARLTAAHFVVATGSKVAPSPLAALDRTGYITSDEALSLARLPASLVVLGGGAVGVELAQFFARFDVKVTLVQRDRRLLSHLDPATGAVLEDVFRREGITLYTGTRLMEARRQGSSKEVVFEHQGQTVRVTGEEILFAMGRQANTAGLGLELAGVRTDADRIVTDPYLQTSAPHIFAAGDCTGRHQIVHLALQQAELAVHNITHPDQRRAADERLLTQVIFTDPQVATVGLTEERARQLNVPYRVASHRFGDHGKSLLMEAPDGFVKLLAGPGRGEILGACCVGPSAGELIHEIIVALHARLTVGELAALPHYHPSLAEIWTYPAAELAGLV